MIQILRDIWERGLPKLTPLKDFLSNSTIHGLPNIASAKSLVVRIFWIAVVLTSFGVATYLISSSYTEWTDSPVSSMTTTRPISELEFTEVTVCPPKGSNTVLNQVLDRVKEEKLNRESLTKLVNKIFLEKPSRMFARDMKHLMYIGSWTDLVGGSVIVPEKNKINTKGASEMSIKTSSTNGSFSTPGYNDEEYHGDFYKSSHLLHFQLNISPTLNDKKSLKVNVSAAQGVQWSYRKQENRMKLYQKKLTFSAAKNYCVNLGGHLASVGSEMIDKEILETANGFQQEHVWIGATDEAEEKDWVWLDRTSWNKNYTKWAKNEPNNLDDNEDCMTLQESEWHDVGCLGAKHPFICAVEPIAEQGERVLEVNENVLEGGDNMYSVQIWWKHNSSTKTTSEVPGIQISWQLEGSERKEENKKTVTLQPTLKLVITNNTTWSQAESSCVRDGGHLVSITSQEEQDEVNEVLKDQGCKWNLVFWLGGSDEKIEGNWTWSDGRVWNEEQQTRLRQDGLQGENCLVWRCGEWLDWDCTKTKGALLGFICRLPTMMSILGKVTKLIHHSLDQGVELQDLWRVILKHRRYLEEHEWFGSLLKHSPSRKCC